MAQHQDQDLFQCLPDALVLEVFRQFAWHANGISDRVQLPDGSQARVLVALSLACRRFRKLITEGSPLWSRVELTGVERCWKTLEHQQSFLRWLKPKQASIRELQFTTTPRSIIHSGENVVALLTGVAPHLRAVGIQAVIPAASISALGQCRELTELHLNCESDFDLGVLRQLIKLQRVVTFLPGVIPEDFPMGGRSLMPWLAGLPQLRELTLQGVPAEWAAWVEQLTGLRDLTLRGFTASNLGSEQLHRGLSQLQGLTSLHVEGSQYLAIGDADTVMFAAARLSQLQRLVIHNCTVLSEQHWCPSLVFLSRSLTHLELHELWGLRNPMQLSSLTNLRCLSFTKPDIPGIGGIPAGFRSDVNAWQRVERLTLQNCDFTVWPKGMFSLQHLQHLDLSQNKLPAISPQISRLILLNELILRDNDELVVSSEVVCTLQNLKLLDVRGCEPAMLEGSLPMLIRHVPAFLFSCLRTPTEPRKPRTIAWW